MGADQIGFLVQGPAVLTEKLVERARRRAKQIDNTIIAYGKARGRKDALRSKYFEMVDDGLNDVVPEGPFVEKALDEFVKWWNDEGLSARDTVCCADRHRKDGIVVFAGEMSWGDTPGGVGYSNISAMASANLLWLLDIR